MKDLSIFFRPATLNKPLKNDTLYSRIIQNTKGDFPELNKEGLAFFYVPEYRNLEKGIQIIPNNLKNNFRNHLYKLYLGENWTSPLYDLGDILPGEDINDTFYALKTVSSELIKKDIIPVIIGGTQDLTKAIFDGYESLEQLVNLTTVDSQLDLGEDKQPITSSEWLSSILMKQPSYLFNYCNIGAQGHYISSASLKLFEDMFFDILRLRQVSSNIRKVEPFLRNTDVLSLDLNSIKASEHQNKYYTSPNGLFSHEACRLMRYAGISDKLTSMGIFNYFSEGDKCTDELVAQLLWYFIEGYSNRKGDFPKGSRKKYTKFTVFIENLEEELIFYKSDKSNRWWIEVPYPGKTNSNLLRHQLIPCDYDTYLEAMKGEIPNLWWKTYQKMA